MKLLIAPDSFKETLTAMAAAEAIARGWRSARPEDEIDLCPMADGGEGTVDALVNAAGGQWLATPVSGPLGEPVDATWGKFGDTAVIEMAVAAGLVLVPTDRRDPTRTTTFGVGQLIIAALDAGCKNIIVGIGGSATTDGGAGMAQALGMRFVTSRERKLADDHKLPLVANPFITGGDLAYLASIDRTTIDPRITTAHITIACDVTNPLCGPTGAAAVYGPQKGASPRQVEQLDAGLAHLASLVPDVDAAAPGMGAAGGLGFGLVAFCGATLERGIDIIMNAVGFDQRAAKADLVITGEGRIDGQSIQGKTVIGIAKRAAQHNTPTIALVGSRGDDAELCLQHGLREIHAVTDHVTIEAALAGPARHLEALAANVARSERRD